MRSPPRRVFADVLVAMVVTVSAARADTEFFVESEGASFLIPEARWRQVEAPDESCLLALEHREHLRRRFTFNRAGIDELSAETLGEFAGSFAASLGEAGYQEAEARRSVLVGVDALPGLRLLFRHEDTARKGEVWVLIFTRERRGFWFFGSAPVGEDAAAEFDLLALNLSFPQLPPAQTVSLTLPEPLKFSLPAGWRSVPAPAPTRFAARRRGQEGAMQELSLLRRDLSEPATGERIFELLDDALLTRAGFRHEAEPSGVELRVSEFLVGQQPVRWCGYRRGAAGEIPLVLYIMAWARDGVWFQITLRSEADAPAIAEAAARDFGELRASLAFPARELEADRRDLPAETQAVQVRARLIGSTWLHLGLLFEDAQGRALHFEGRDAAMEVTVRAAPRDEGGEPRVVARLVRRFSGARDLNLFNHSPLQRIRWDEITAQTARGGDVLDDAAAFRGVVEVKLRTQDGRVLTASTALEPDQAGN